MIKPISDLQRTQVSYLFFKWEILFLAVALLIPLLSWTIWRDGMMLARSGSLVVFCALLAEFNLLHKANIKHIRNAERVSAGAKPLDFSNKLNHIALVSLGIALMGTVLWGYGDLLVK